MSKSLIGKKVEEYKLETLLGEGGMASVYRALDTRLNRYVAVKVILPTFRTDYDYRLRFEREAQAIAQLDHSNIITIYRYGDVDNILYMAMQYVDGADLAAVIESYHKDGAFIEFEEIINLAQQIGQALDYAHSKGVIHRDIKPHNVLINQQGQAILTDFGLALLTEVGTYGEIFGSPHYIAPEQAISSAGAVPQSDLYALGVMLYEMLTGTLPFDADEPLDIAMKHMSEDVPSPRSIRPELSQQIENVLLKAVAKQPDDRYATGKELADALKQAMTAPNAEKASKKSKHTIPERVVLEVEANPLPPIPPATTTQTVPHVSPPTQSNSVAKPVDSASVSLPQKSIPTPSTQKKQKSSFPIVPIIGVVVVLIAIIAGIMLVISRGEDDAGGQTSQSIETVESDATVPVIIPTDVPIQPTDNVMPIDRSTSAVPTTENWMLRINWIGDDSIFVELVFGNEFPLANLELTGNGSVNGSAWNVSSLQLGQCVAVFKDNGNPQSANTTCELVGGTNVTRSGAERFWTTSFAANFNGARVTRCDDNPCLVEIRR